MKRLSLILASIFILVGSAVAEKPIRAVMLKSISDVETGGRKDFIGGLGERSQFQIMASTWAEKSKVPQAQASDREIERVANLILDHIEKVLAQRGTLSPRMVATAWNAGLRGSLKPCRSARDYADRVANTYDANLRNR